MAFYYLDPERGRLGPCSLEELLRLHAAGRISMETRISIDESEATIPFRSVWEQSETPRVLPPPLPGEFNRPQSTLTSATPQDASQPASDAATNPAQKADWGPGSSTHDAGPTEQAIPSVARERSESFTGQAGEDIRVILPHLTSPLQQLRGFRWVRDRRALAIAAIGLLPLAIYEVFRHPWQLGNAYWAMALYFSTLWAMFFHYAFPTPEADVRTAAVCFFTTGLVSVGALLFAYRVWPMTEVAIMISAPDLWLRWFGFVVGVGLPEELCKALVLFIILARQGPLRPQVLLFYGLMSGLGFGIYEGVNYQTQQNFEFAFRVSGQANAQFAAEYYLLNLIRLTTLPFLHAIWSGIAGYFIGFAGQYPGRQRGLILVAISLPAFLHGTYNTFDGAISMIVALVSVFTLNLYLAKRVEFERLLDERK